MRGTHQGQQSGRTASTGQTDDCKRQLPHAPHDFLQDGGHRHMNRRPSVCRECGVTLRWERQEAGRGEVWSCRLMTL